ncbi:MAG: hypothetical protein PHP15_08685 [Bacteroidales bacterium]|nr:hypothetical protein [Bacteroidales bacterium]
MFYLFIVFVVISLLVIFFVFNRKRNIKQTPGNNENDSFTEQVKKDVEVVISTNNTAEDKPNGSEKLTDEADTPEAHAKKSGPSDEEPKRTADNTDKINAIDDIHDVSETDSETNVITNENNLKDYKERLLRTARLYEKQLKYKRAYLTYWKLYNILLKEGDSQFVNDLKIKLDNLYKIFIARIEDFEIIRNSDLPEVLSPDDNHSEFYNENKSYSKKSETFLNIPPDIKLSDKEVVDDFNILLSDQRMNKITHTESNSNYNPIDKKKEIRDLVYKANRSNDYRSALLIYKEAADLAYQYKIYKGWKYSYYNICHDHAWSCYKRLGDVQSEYDFIKEVLKVLRPYMKEGLDVFESRFRELNRIISPGLLQKHKSDLKLKKYYDNAFNYEQYGDYAKAMENYTIIACSYLFDKDRRYIEIIDKKCDIYRLLGYRYNELEEMKRALLMANKFNHPCLKDYEIHFEERRETI